MKHRPRQPAKQTKCGNKNCYHSQKLAEQVAREQELLDISGQTKIAVYFCSRCGKWHLTSRP